MFSSLLDDLEVPMLVLTKKLKRTCIFGSGLNLEDLTKASWCYKD